MWRVPPGPAPPYVIPGDKDVLTAHARQEALGGTHTGTAKLDMILELDSLR